VSLLRRWYSPYADGRVWKDSAHLVLDLPVGIALFSVLITMVSLSAGLLITLVGLPLLALTVAMGRWVSVAERARARLFLGIDVPAWPPLSKEGNWWTRLVRWFGDGPGWSGFGYGTLMLPWGIVAFTVAVVAWSVAWSLALVPLWFWTFDSASWAPARPWVEILGAVAATAIGWLLVAALPRAMRALASVDETLVKLMLGPREIDALQARVEHLEESREAGTESAALELRRIERDLHDGAQQRLVSVAMDLGLARDRLEQTGDEKTKELVARAHDESKQAIADLRDLVRGIHPTVLTDRGLDAAVSALAARCPVSVDLHTDLPRRLSPAVEATAYFVVAEALTNVAKHSGASMVTLRLVDRHDVVVVDVRDDGAGGAREGLSGGLRGLHDRVRSVDGTWQFDSPIGGPTVLLVELPCGS
jgi:signal transduction histidine kinase